MKTKVILSLLLSLTFCLLSSQVPQGFNYQALAGDVSGNPLKNTDLQVKISILSDTLIPVTVWEELHSIVRTDAHGVFSLVFGLGLRQPASSVAAFSDIDWTTIPLYIKTQIYYQSSWKNMGSAKLWTVPFAMVADNLSGTVKKLAVTGQTSAMDEALFEVKNKDGQTVFAVYNEGVRIYVDDGAKGSKGGFAIGGFGTSKAPSQNLLVVNPDSVRVYIDTNTGKGVKGGFAIGGFGTSKTTGEEYLRVTRDSTKVYLNNAGTRSVKGGFSIGGFGTTKGLNYDYLSVSPDSTRIYVRKDSTDASSTFNIVAINQDLTQRFLLKANADTVDILGVLDLQNNLIVSGDINIGGTINIISDIDGNTYSTVKIGTQVWIAGNLKTTKYNDGTAIPLVPDSTSWVTFSTPGYCWYNNDATTYKTTYGALYNWYVVDAASNGGKNVCPINWHVPTDTEWTTLTTYLGGESVAGGKLKETGTTHWQSPNEGATNEIGFTALPGGGRHGNGIFYSIGELGVWWSSTEYDISNAWDIAVINNSTLISSLALDKKNGYSVRCLKDN